MQGSSRASLTEARKHLDAAAAALSGSTPAGAATLSLADDLFAATAVLDSSASLRRALTNPGREGDQRATVIRGLVHGKVSPAAEELLAGLVASRWSVSRDVADAAEALAVSAVVIAADQAGRLGALEDELFRFERTAQADHGLRDALSDHRGTPTAKAALVDTLLAGKVAPETERLAREAVFAPRGRRLSAVLESYLTAAAGRREQSVAHATVAAPISAARQDRLQAALSKVFGRQVQLNVDIDPSLIGGIRVRVGDEVVDGSILGRLDEAHRRLAG